MRLRHYLKGLGIGMAVTALILHFSVHAAEPSMTDEEVIARARELGMIENVVLSRNDPTISGGSVSGDGLLSASGNEAAGHGVSGNEIAGHDANGTDIDANRPSDGDGGSVDGSGHTDAPNGGDDGTDNNGTDISGQGNGSGAAGNGDALTEDPLDADTPEAAGNQEGVEAEPQEGMTGVETGQESVSITISNGDSSVSVAGRLAALGLVSSQAEYDAYLCSHGYDRSIRTGVHVIPVGATEQQIAEIITSKP